MYYVHKYIRVLYDFYNYQDTNHALLFPNSNIAFIITLGAIPLLHIFENLIEFPFKIKDVCNVQKHKLTILSISSAIFDFENSIRGNYLILILVYSFN